MDTIRLSSFRIQATHGCYDHEKKAPQTFIVDIECGLSTQLSASDDLSQTINYEIIRSQVLEIFAQPPLNLIETLAVEIAEKLLATMRISKVIVKIAKPDIWEDALPSVEVTRQK
jgi:dihydroneopterin aldolase